ncbi:MAG: MarR family transcriptional regulator [Pyrinomonadaceae bacterium]
MSQESPDKQPAEKPKAPPPLAQKAYLTLLSTADSARSIFENLCSGSEITRQQYNVLRILRGAEPDGLPTLTIADRMIEKAPGITRMIDRLEKKGFVYRMPCPDDRRFVYCRITKEGLDFLDEMDAPVESANLSVFDGLSEDELEDLIALLEKVRSAHCCPQEEKSK